MTKVKCFSVSGLKMWFPSSDHTPPHFHVQKDGEWCYRVFFLEDESEMLEVKWRLKDMANWQRKEILEYSAAYRFDLLGEWSLIPR
jgi:hypothetical protein